MNKTPSRRCRLRIIIPAYPAFNIYSYVASITTSLGPISVATSANELDGWDVEVVDENNYRRYGPRTESGGVDHAFLQKIRPADVVGFYGGLTSTIPRLYEVARFYKEQGCITLTGGQHFLDQESIEEGLRSNLDYIVVGEGEEAIKELLHAIVSQDSVAGIAGLAYVEDGRMQMNTARSHIRDFDKLPLPDFSLLRYAKIKLYPIGRIRGCGMNCEFCTVKGKPRFASPERLLAHISSIVEKQDARHFFIVDDLFGQQRNETIRFCQMLLDYQQKIRRRLDFTAQIRLDKAGDTELLQAMRAAGINAVAIGYESPIDEELQMMNKALRAEDMISQTKIFHRHGFLVHGMFIFGYPKHEGMQFTMSVEERIKRYRTFIKRARVDTIQVLLPVPLPGTEFRQRLKAQNRIFPRCDIGWQYYDGNFPLFEPDDPMTAEEMQLAVRKIMGKFYRLRYAFLLALNILSFPTLLFYLDNIKSGWRIWYRGWRNRFIRLIGWMTMQNWLKAFKRDSFIKKLRSAQLRLHGKQARPTR